MLVNHSVKSSARLACAKKGRHSRPTKWEYKFKLLYRLAIYRILLGVPIIPEFGHYTSIYIHDYITFANHCIIHERRDVHTHTKNEYEPKTLFNYMPLSSQRANKSKAVIYKQRTRMVAKEAKILQKSMGICYAVHCERLGVSPKCVCC